MVAQAPERSRRRVKKIAVIGSRSGINPQSVALKINELYAEHGAFILVSGGGNPGSVNFVAEQTAIEFGIPMISFRPKRLPDYGVDAQYGVDEWRIHRSAGTVIRIAEPAWADWKSAAQYRSLLIVERASEAVAFHHNDSRGTAFEIEMFEKAGKPVEVIPPF